MRIGVGGLNLVLFSDKRNMQLINQMLAPEAAIRKDTLSHHNEEKGCPTHSEHTEWDPQNKGGPGMLSRRPQSFGTLSFCGTLCFL